MKKIEIIGNIDQYNSESGEFHGYVQQIDRGYMQAMVKFVGKKQWKLILGKHYRKRTTGKDSQNHRINGFIQQICEDTGNDFDTIKYYFKRKAIRRGYPSKTDPEGEAVPVSEAILTTIEAAYLIDEIEQYAAENSILLYEGKREYKEEKIYS